MRSLGAIDPEQIGTADGGFTAIVMHLPIWSLEWSWRPLARDFTDLAVLGSVGARFVERVGDISVLKNFAGYKAIFRGAVYFAYACSVTGGEDIWVGGGHGEGGGEAGEEDEEGVGGKLGMHVSFWFYEVPVSVLFRMCFWLSELT